MVNVAPEQWEKSAQLIQSWPEIATAIHYDQLSTSRQAEARNEFFKIVIQPQLSAADLARAKAEFERQVEESLLAHSE